MSALTAQTSYATACRSQSCRGMRQGLTDQHLHASGREAEPVARKETAHKTRAQTLTNRTTTYSSRMQVEILRESSRASLDLPPNGKCELATCMTVSLTHAPPEVVKDSTLSEVACEACDSASGHRQTNNATTARIRTLDEENTYSASGCGRSFTKSMASSTERTEMIGSNGPKISS